MTEKDPNILTLNVSEDVKSEDVGPGGDKKSDSTAEYYEKIMAYLSRYVKPHKVVSRWVTQDDIETLISEGNIMANLCHVERGIYGNASGIAHPQIEDKNPLRFFAMPDGLLVVNPVIINHTKAHVDKVEGCMSYPEEPMIKVQIFHKITVCYQTIEKIDDKLVLSKMIEEGYSGNLAAIFQHEVGHLNGQYIYDEDYAPEKVVGLPNEELNIEVIYNKYGTN